MLLEPHSLPSDFPGHVFDVDVQLRELEVLGPESTQGPLHQLPSDPKPPVVLLDEGIGYEPPPLKFKYGRPLLDLGHQIAHQLAILSRDENGGIHPPRQLHA